MSNTDKAKAGVIVAGGVVALAGVAWLVWSARKGVGDLFKGIGQVGADAAQTATALTGATAGTTSAVTSWLPNRDPQMQQGANQVAPKPGEFTVGQGQLRIVVSDKRDSTPGALKKTTVTLTVVDQEGRPVPTAVIKGIANFAPTRQALGTIERHVDYLGRVSLLEWTVANVPGIDSEDDITFVARAPGYNPSPEVTVK